MSVPVKFQKIFEQYKEELQMQGYRNRYIKTIHIRLKHLFNYLEENDLSLVEMNIHHAGQFQGSITRKLTINGTKYSFSSVVSIISIASSFYQFLKARQFISSNPFSFIRRIRMPLKLPDNILKEKQLISLLNYFKNYREAKSIRDRINLYKMHVISEVLYSTGLRMSELADLRQQDIDFDRGVVKVFEGKGGKQRIAFLNEYTSKVLSLYLKHMRELSLTASHKRDTIFGSGFDCFGKYVNKQLKKACEKLKIPIQTSHGFRHAFGFHLLKSGCDIRFISRFLGHRRLKTTEIYTKVEVDSLKEVLDKFHPRNLKRKQADVRVKQILYA